MELLRASSEGTSFERDKNFFNAPLTLPKSNFSLLSVVRAQSSQKISQRRIKTSLDMTLLCKDRKILYSYDLVKSTNEASALCP